MLVTSAISAVQNDVQGSALTNSLQLTQAPKSPVLLRRETTASNATPTPLPLFSLEGTLLLSGTVTPERNRASALVFRRVILDNGQQ